MRSPFVARSRHWSLQVDAQLWQRLSRAIHDSLHQISKLLRGELVSVEIRYQLPIAVDDYRVKGMREQAFLTPEIHAEHS
jgi:hypothetical protein